MTPRVSVVLPVFNGAQYINTAVGDILRQTFSDFELIAINDGSTDGSDALLDACAASDARMHVVHQTNGGLCAALVRGCGLASGELVARMDVDDRSHPERLARQVALMTAQPSMVLCGTWALQASLPAGPDTIIAPPNEHTVLLALLRRGGNPFVHGSVMFRRGAYTQLEEGYRVWNYGEDYDLWLRLSEHGTLGMVEEPLYIYFLTPSGISFATFGVQSHFKRLMLKLDAERRSGGERTDWRTEWRNILAAGREQSNAATRAADASYARALRALWGRRWREYHLHVSEAAAGIGPRASRARFLKRFRWASPLVRLALLRQLVRAGDVYSRPLPQGTPMPDWASRAAADDALRATHNGLSALDAGSSRSRGGATL